MDHYRQLVEVLRTMQGVVVAFSGGVDSSLLAAAAVDALGDRALAVTGCSPSYQKEALERAGNIAQLLGIRHMAVKTLEMDDPEYVKNPPDRCRHCKQELFSRLKDIASKEGFSTVVEGSNVDDTGDYRPGIQAARDLGVRSPLMEVGLGKLDIRRMAKELGLPNWDLPAQACLASRIPYGEDITSQRLARIEQAEQVLHELGFQNVRVRDHGTVARIEAAPEDMHLLIESAMRSTVVVHLKQAGYLHIAVDMEGYRQGSMNAMLNTSHYQELQKT